MSSYKLLFGRLQLYLTYLEQLRLQLITAAAARTPDEEKISIESFTGAPEADAYSRKWVLALELIIHRLFIRHNASE